jgi:predicted dehydrogenase
MPVRIAVTEVGHWHALKDAAYLTHLPKIPGATLVALQDPDTERTTHVAAQLDPVLGSPQLFTDYRQMLAATKPDFVLALGRHSVMAEIAHHLLDAGYPFLMEKPMGLNAEEVRGIAEKADATGGFAAVPLFQRYLPFVAKAKAMMHEGHFGPLSHMSLRSIRPSSDRYVRWGAPWMLDPAIAGGGCLRNVGLHGLDMFLHILGEEAEILGAQISRRALARPVEDYACVQIRSRSGVLGTLQVGNTFPYEGPPNLEKSYVRAGGEYLLSGRDAMLESRDGVLRVVAADRQETASAKPEKVPAFTILHDTLDRWRRGKPPVTDAWDCWRAMVLADQAYRLADVTCSGSP